MAGLPSNLAIAPPPWIFPGAVMDFDFLNQRYYQQGKANNFNNFSFTRSSTGTFVGADGLIYTAANNIPRFSFDPVLGSPLGLLIEDTSTNFQTHSQFDSVWTGNVSYTLNAGTAPDGTNTATLITPSASNLTQNAVENATTTLTISTLYTFSCFAKAGTSNFVSVQLRVGTNWVGGVIGASADLSLGTIAISFGTGTAAIQAFPNGWYLISVTGTTAASGLATQTNWITVQSALGTDTYAGSGQSVYIWGAQFEKKAWATSYMPTVASTVTRSSDIMRFAKFPDYVSDSTLFAQALRSGATAASSRLIIAADGTGNNLNQIVTNSLGGVRGQSKSANVLNANLGGATFTQGAVFKGAFAVANADFDFWTNGSEAKLSVGASPTGINEGGIAGDVVNATSSAQYFQRAAYFNYRVPAPFLKQITT